MLFAQLVDDDLGCASYLIGDDHLGEALVVDPAYAIEQYLEEAERRGVRIVRVLETHTHADHVSGHGRFALEHGIPVSIHAAAEPEFPFDPLDDGQTIELGDVAVQVLHTPGHRPEHCGFAVIDRTRAPEPWLVITGDSLLVGDAARPDLATEADEGARGMYRSILRLLELPDGVELYPGHVAGSLCGAGISSKTSSTIGFERRFNAAAASAGRGEDAYAGEHADSAAPRPPNMQRIVAVNRGPFLGAQPPLVPAQTLEGASVLDVRPAEVFSAGYVPGAISVPVSGSKFATKAGFVVPEDKPVVIHASSEADAEHAVRLLHAVAVFDIAGYVTDPKATETLEPIGLEELERRFAEGDVEILDVREPSERDDGFIAGSRNVPYRLVPAFTESFQPGKPVVTICDTGMRAVIAASVLAAAGIEAHPVVEGGVDDWDKTVALRRCGSG